ncbi:MAG: c-type cytochrome [Chlorobiaceae bacterium]|nr:c-type cytochrome [Chlorobiaceae bacterium]
MSSYLNISLSALLMASASIAFSAPGLAASKASIRQNADVDPRGQVLSLSCAGCHGTDGKSAGIIPSFYGKSPEYIESALRDFKAGERASTVMMRHAKGYTDDEIHLIAQYFGTVWGKNK